MERFSYIRAASIAQAVTLLNEPQVRSRVLAGGTDLVLLAREDRRLCDRVVDITQIGELHRITAEGDTIRIGAAATFSEVVESPLVNATAPVLVEACRQVGATQVRNMGTLGGNVANAAACADSLPALVCLDAVAEVLVPAEASGTFGPAEASGTFGPAAPLEWPVAELVVRPNRTLIPAGGLLVSLRFQVPAAGSRSTFIKLGRRNAMAISRLTVAALGRLDAAGRVAEARLVPGSATPQILRFSAVEKLLLGQQPGDELFDAAGRLAVDEMARLSGRRWSSEYKEPALAGMVCQALATVFAPGADKDATRTTHEN